MKRFIVALILVMFALPVSMQAQRSVGTNAGDEDGGGGDGGPLCFFCSNSDIGSYERHCDVRIAVSDKRQGEYHDCSEGYMYGHCSQHPIYNQTSSTLLFNATTDETLVKVLLENTNARLDMRRLAVQLLDANGDIVFHRRISKAQAERLDSAIGAGATENAALGSSALKH